MKGRRKKLLRSFVKKGCPYSSDEIEKRLDDLISKKELKITTFHSIKLEELLKNSTKNLAHEIVSTLVSQPGEGILIQLEKVNSKKKPLNRTPLDDKFND
jgi:coenzyme F420-reducing hydrogenase gamma subunit